MATYSGGCQCGAVRYRYTEKPTSAHVCHCRMCQKAFGAFYAPLVGGPKSAFEVTRGEISIFNSSDLARRGFCNQCGTPLSFDFSDSEWISVSIGSLDRPQDFPPVDQHGIEARLPYTNAIGSLPDQGTTEHDQIDRAAEIARSNHQHPDHDTLEWKPTGDTP